MKHFNRVFLFWFTSFVLLLLVSFPHTHAQEVQRTISDGYVEAQGSLRSPIDDQRVFLLGNSQVAGAFGLGMSFHITAAGATYFSRAGEPGWGVENWWRHRHNISRMFRQHQPTLVLIGLGGNDFQRSARAEYPNEVANLWMHIRTQAELNKPDGMSVSYCWISPARVVEPATEIQSGRERAARIIQDTIGDEFYIDSRDITGRYGRTPDGIHFTYLGGMNWARQIIPRIEVCIRNQ